MAKVLWSSPTRHDIPAAVTALLTTGGRTVAGFRVGENLAWGRHLYIDDLSTMSAARGQGHARALLEWLHIKAERLGCHQVHLDSEVGANRTAAHRLYLNPGYRISSHHFTHDISPSPLSMG